MCRRYSAQWCITRNPLCCALEKSWFGDVWKKQPSCSATLYFCNNRGTPYKIDIVQHLKNTRASSNLNCIFKVNTCTLDFWLQPKTKQNCGKLFQIDVNFAWHISTCMCGKNHFRPTYVCVRTWTWTWKRTMCGAQHISNANMKMRRTKSCLATAPPLWSWTSSIHSKQQQWWWWGESLAEEWMADFCNSYTLVQVLCKTYSHVHIRKSCHSAPSPSSDCESASECFESRELQCS